MRSAAVLGLGGIGIARLELARAGRITHRETVARRAPQTAEMPAPATNRTEHEVPADTVLALFERQVRRRPTDTGDCTATRTTASARAAVSTLSRRTAFGPDPSSATTRRTNRALHSDHSSQWS
ncbi:hypothetical protein GCM10023318_46500 [Nocardia callitridis]|uniref:Uncharacterized protein n=1 Tax=Nocardia callitridis TaxID=648753 RepID=A0ABP9KRH0_9NOCA